MSETECFCIESRMKTDHYDYVFSDGTRQQRRHVWTMRWTTWLIEIICAIQSWKDPDHRHTTVRKHRRMRMSN